LHDGVLRELPNDRAERGRIVPILNIMKTPPHPIPSQLNITWQRFVSFFIINRMSIARWFCSALFKHPLELL
jgi:hypothetical protein